MKLRKNNKKILPIFTNYPFSRWAPIFEKEAEFNLTQNALLTTVPMLPHEWMVEFLFKRTNSSTNEWTSIFHMTVGGDRSTIGDRTPAVFFNPNFGFQIASACNGSDNFNKDFPAPPIDVWTKIKVSQELLHGQFKYRIFIDGSEKLNVGNLKAVGFENVKVYAANPWFHAQAGAIKNLSINIKGD